MKQETKRELYRKVFDTVGKLRPCEVKDTIVLAGSQRSGTTWVLELLRTLRGYKALNEPLLRKQLWKYAEGKDDFHERTYLPPGQHAPAQRRYLRRALRGQLGSPRRWQFDAESDIGKLIEHGRKRKLVVKFCHVNRMLNWLDEQFQVRGLVLIVRHPCAAISSMLRWEHGWNDVSARDKDQKASPLYIRHLPESVQDVFAPVVERVSTPAEVLAAVWCIDHYLLLTYNTSYPWLMLPYERLMLRGQEELQRLASALKFEVTEDMARLLYKPSSTARGRFEDDTEAQLSKWKRELTTAQVNGILGVVEDAGLSSIYNDSPKPDLRRLNDFQKKSYRWEA